ncbi:PepSY domain-containing protein [Sphingomonas horti]|nr:PepSY domain-containing protein [Sphingomonas horti]
MMRIVSIALVALALAAPATAQRRGDQYRAYEAHQSGRVLSLREIEDRILPRMRGSTYLGPEFDGGVYRLKFMRSGSVIWVDVDARTGAVIGRSGY